MAARRLPPTPDSAPNPPRRRVRFRFDGRSYEGVEGEPLAVALLAADRLILSRSFRFHRPRGLMCDTGQCGWCECEVDGRPSVRSCLVPVREGLEARSEHAWPTVDRDLFGWLDVVSRWVPPTFYHHRFLRPRRLRKAYLDVIRGFGGRGRLGRGTNETPPKGRALRDLEADVLVVGGGRSGVEAADAAAAQGSSVVVVEAVAGRARPTDPAVRILDGATAVGWYDGVVAAVDADTLWSIRAGSVVAATGSYERVPPVRGADLPGVMGARRVLDTVTRLGVLPGERPLLVGEPEPLAPVADALVAAGAHLVGPIPTLALRRVLGRRRVTGAVLVDLDGRTRREPVDLIVFADRVPNLELILAAGAAVEARDGVLAPILDASGRTSVPGLSVAGSATGRPRATPEAASPAGRTLVCFCEDVHADEIQAQVGAGYGDPELVKRRTGALTGPCQGKYCLQAFAAILAEGGTASADAVGLPTTRPPLRPTRLGDLVPAAAERPRSEP